ncbi:MAG: glycosyltransferase [Saprospiraceae bacterium]|nr:glycosyltransferase [Saprospiraceae bacterium]
MTILFTVTNDLTYDQRMHRICGTLAAHGYSVMLVGRSLSHSIHLVDRPFSQKRLRCWFQKGFLFYAEYNIRLFFFLLFSRYDAVCSIDLDTLLAGCCATLLRRKKRVFDAHEYFTEVPEVVGRPFVKKCWELVARACLPFYQHAYTVGPALAKIFEERYGLRFDVVRNVARRASQAKPLVAPRPPHDGASFPSKKPGHLLYLGALNEGRGIETLLEAMTLLPTDAHLWLAGEGDLSDALRHRTAELGANDRVTFLGYVNPEETHALVANAWLGLNLFENRGLSYYYSLANKFFHYVQAGVPVLNMDFPEYRVLNEQHEVAFLLDTLSPQAVADAVKKLLHDEAMYRHLQHNCLTARDAWSWEAEEQHLLKFWEKVFA